MPDEIKQEKSELLEIIKDTTSIIEYCLTNKLQSI